MLSQADIETFFKTLGKMRYMNQVAVDATALFAQSRVALIGQSLAQVDDGSVSLYEEVISAFNDKVSRSIKGLEKVPSLLAQHAEKYLTTDIAAKAGLTDATVQDILDAVRGVMVTSGMYLGADWSLYIRIAFGYENLPIAGGGTLIDDAWVSGTVV